MVSVSKKEGIEAPVLGEREHSGAVALRRELLIRPRSGGSALD